MNDKLFYLLSILLNIALLVIVNAADYAILTMGPLNFLGIPLLVVSGIIDIVLVTLIYSIVRWWIEDRKKRREHEEEN